MRKLLESAILFVTAFFLVLPSAYAQEPVVSAQNLSASTMLENLFTQIPALMQLVTAVAYVMGMYFIFYGIGLLKQYGESRTMMSHQHTLKGPIIFIVIGTALLYLPSSVQIGLTTFWSTPNPYGYLDQNSQWTSFIQACFTIIQLVGTIAFIRGLVIFTQLGGHGGHHPGAFAKGLTHVIGGILCINIYQFVQVIIQTFGLPSILP